LANVTANDFGFITTGTLLERCANTLDTMNRLERERGHFYNWYDTQSLKPLNPVYVSTVDSCNLCGHLLTLRIALRALGDAPIIGVRTLRGIEDTLGILIETASTNPSIDAFRKRLHEALRQPVPALLEIYTSVIELSALAAPVVGS